MPNGIESHFSLDYIFQPSLFLIQITLIHITMSSSAYLEMLEIPRLCETTQDASVNLTRNENSSHRKELIEVKVLLEDLKHVINELETNGCVAEAKL